MKSYGSSTEEFLRNVAVKEQKDYILKEIAKNLAYIADELAEANRFNRELNGFCHMRFDDVRLEQEPDPKPEPQDDKKDCFICGKEIGLKDGCYDDGGCIITSDGDLFLACPKCKNRFDALIQHFVMPNEVFC